MSVEHLLDPELRAKAQEASKAARKSAPSRRQKMAAHAETFTEMRRRFPKMALPIIAQAERGSVPAMVKLNCLDCSGWVKAEVRDCVIPSCPFFPIRPYQTLQGRNPNDRGEAGMTDRLRASIGFPPSAVKGAR